MFLRTAACLALITATAPGQDEATKPSSHEELFGIESIWDLHIVVPNDAWASMSPEKSKKINYEARFPYTKAHVRIAGHDEIVVGLRFKGNSTFWKMPKTILKRSFKLDFDRFKKGQTFLGLKKLNINNNYYDTTQLREALSFKAYREALVPASRTAFARVYLTIQGSAGENKIEGEYLGLYTLVEQVDRGLLKRQTGAKGALLKPEGKFLPYFGDKWDERYEKAYRTRTRVGAEAGEAIIGLARLMRDYGSAPLSSASQKDFQTRLEQRFDVDEFLRYLAVTTLIGNGDSPLLMFAHNYYLAVSDKNNLVSMLPWDLNNSLGGMGEFTGGQFENLSIYRPSDLPLIARILEIPDYKKRYTNIVSKLIQGPCSAKRMTEAYRTAGKTVAKAIAQEAKRSKIVTNFGIGRGKSKPYRRKSKPVDLEHFFVTREKSVLDQLAGRSQGVVLGGGKKSKRGKEDAGKGFDAKSYLAGARKKLDAAVQAGEMTAEEAEARLTRLKKSIEAKFGSSGKTGGGKKAKR
jgi:CotH kinase protein